MLVTKRYLQLPVSKLSRNKTVTIRHGEKEVASFLCPVNPVAPDAFFHYDCSAFLGKNIEITTSPKIAFLPKFTAKKTAPEEEYYRPAAHFTAPFGYINNPNGLAVYEGKYHLFYQHNPYGFSCNNQHWGHAVSQDLRQWKHSGDTLFPDEGLVFSGSAMIDEKNVTGLQENEHLPFLLFYTNTKDFSQWMAYSTDGGSTFQNYAHNPVVPHITDSNRDPKVVFDQNANLYYMALYLTHHQYALLVSKDLLSWQLRQELTLAEDAECPNFFSLENEGQTYYIFEGASGTYQVGTMQGGEFVPVQEVCTTFTAKAIPVMLPRPL